MLLVAYGSFIPKVEVLKFLIPATIFLFAIFNILSIKKVLKIKHSYVLFFAIWFGFFNGLGTSKDVLLQLESNESEFIPIIQVALGAGSSIFIVVFGLLTVVTLLRKTPKIDNKTLTFGLSIIIMSLSIPLMFSQIFN